MITINLVVVISFIIGGTLCGALPHNNPKTNVNGRVVGGTPAVTGQFPFMASLRSIPSGSQFCGATIISLQSVLSAAHCTYGTPDTDIDVAVGSIFINGGLVHRSSRIINHPNYNEDSLENDISIVQVGVPFIETETVRPIGIGASFIDGVIQAVVIGWGQTAHPGPSPNVLQWLTLSIISLQECRDRHTTYAEYIFNSKLCTFTRAGEGICMGDSGGPLVVGNYVVGIPSWVIACAVGYPDVYTRVYSFNNWITANMI